MGEQQKPYAPYRVILIEVLVNLIIDNLFMKIIDIYVVIKNSFLE